MRLKRLSVEHGDAESICAFTDTNGEYVYWEDVAQLIVDVSGLIARIELAHDLHAVFTIKDSKEFIKVKADIADIFKEQQCN